MSCCVPVCVSGFNIGSASTNVAATNTQGSPSSSSAASTAGSGPAAVGSSKSSAVSSSRRDVNQDVCNVPGFTVLQWLLSHHPHIPHVYFMMMALLVGQPVQQLPHDIQVSLCYMYIIIMMIQHFIRCRNMSMKSLQGCRTSSSHDECRTAPDSHRPVDQAHRLAHLPACS